MRTEDATMTQARQRFLTAELPARIDAQWARLPGAAGEDEQARIHNALFGFFARDFDSGDHLLAALPTAP